MEQQVISGMGQVGTAIFNLAPDKTHIYRHDITDETHYPFPEVDNVEGLHICYPHSKLFQNAVLADVEDFDPEILFIHSTVTPITTATISNRAKIPVIYTPIRGQHDNLQTDLKRYKKWITSYNKPALEKAKNILTEMGFSVSVRAISPDQLELIKLLDTTQYAVLIAWAQEAKRFCDKYDVSFKHLRDFGLETHELYNVRPNIRPGFIGGHCLMPNVKTLREIQDSSILEFINKSNETLQEILNQTHRKK